MTKGMVQEIQITSLRTKWIKSKSKGLSTLWRMLRRRLWRNYPVSADSCQRGSVPARRANFRSSPKSFGLRRSSRARHLRGQVRAMIMAQWSSSHFTFKRLWVWIPPNAGLFSSFSISQLHILKEINRGDATQLIFLEQCLDIKLGANLAQCAKIF